MSKRDSASKASLMLPRRDFLKAGGALVIGFSSAGLISDVLLAQGPPIARGPDPRQIDTWLAIHSDNTATVYIGYVELGQGSTTSLLQVSAEELDLDMSQVSTVRLDTDLTPNQGGTYSSSSIARGSPAIRTAAAEARQALLAMASKKLGAPVESMTVSKGVVSTRFSGKTVTYGELIGDKHFDLAFTGKAPLKPVADYKLVGTRPPRNDIPGKVSGTYVYLQHVRLPGMVHGRVVRPRGQGAYGAGAKVATLDENSLPHIPGARVVRKGDFVGVVAEREWDAVRAARDLKITWDMPATLPGSDGLYAAMRAEKTTDHVVLDRGDISPAFAAAARVASGTYHGAYQAHAPFGPNGALADVTPDSALVICSTQDVYATRGTLAGILGLPPQKVRVQYYEGSGTYGHSCYDDVAQAAAILSQLAGKPVRLQFMRWDEHGWDLYGPAHVGEVRAAADANGKIVAYEYNGWHHNWSAVETSQQLALGTPASEWRLGAAQQVNPGCCGAMYEIPNLRLVNHQVPGLGYLKGAWLRSPLDLAFAFASEQTHDELARQAGIDAHESRRRMSRTIARSACSMPQRRPRTGGPRRPLRKFQRENRARARHRPWHASRFLRRRRRRNRSESRNRPGRPETHVRRDRRRARCESRVHREPDQRPARAGDGRMLHEEVTFNETQCHQPGLEQLSDPALRGVPRGPAHVRAASR